MAPAHPATCSFRLHTSKGYATVWPMAPATPPHARPSGTERSFPLLRPCHSATTSFRVPYTAKFRPTYGMTPMTDGSHPLYSASAPSSFTMTLAAWVMEVYCLYLPSTCVVSRPRTMSSGYVADMAKIPAPAPAVRRVRGPSCAFGSDSRARERSHDSRVS